MQIDFGNVYSFIRGWDVDSYGKIYGFSRGWDITRILYVSRFIA